MEENEAVIRHYVYFLDNWHRRALLVLFGFSAEEKDIATDRIEVDTDEYIKLMPYITELQRNAIWRLENGIKANSKITYRPKINII